jgi:deoxyribonuclease-4
LEAEEVARFREARESWGGGPVIAHAAYLVNLAAPDPEVRERSIRGLADELERSGRLGLDGLVVHPGAHLGAGEETGLRAVAESLERVLADSERGSTRILLESTAGQGTVLGYRLEHLETILEHAGEPEAIAICLDTCHLLAAGYPCDTADGVRSVLDESHRRFGADRLACVHVNDSRHPKGSRKDRHGNLGEGEVGEDGLAALVRDPRVAGVPLIVETPNGDDDAGHRRDLDRLRSWLPA